MNGLTDEQKKAIEQRRENFISSSVGKAYAHLADSNPEAIDELMRKAGVL